VKRLTAWQTGALRARPAASPPGIVTRTVVVCVSSIRAAVLADFGSADISDVNRAALGAEVQTVLEEPGHGDGRRVGAVAEVLDRSSLAAAGKVTRVRVGAVNHGSTAVPAEGADVQRGVAGTATAIFLEVNCLTA
jgi:hypothetical protein